MNLKVPLDAITKVEAIHRLNSRQIIFTPNPEILLEARRNPAYLQALKQGTLLLPDGHGLQLVSTLLMFPRPLRWILFLPALLLYLFWKKPFQSRIPEIIHGSDFMNEVIQWSAQHSKSVFFLGGRSGVAEKTAKIFQKRYPKLMVVGTSACDPNEEALKKVLHAKPDVLLVAYGAPKQELWIAKYLSEFKHIHTVMAVGGSFDFWSGEIQRAPRILRQLGLEWLWRLIKQPKQRFKRIWNAVVVFPLTYLSS